MLALQWQLKRSEWWPAERLRDYQLAQLRQLVAHAVRHVAYYGDWLAKGGLRSVEALTLETLLRAPLLRKAHIRENEAALRASAVPREHGSIGQAWTTGSTGEPTRVLHTSLSRQLGEALFVRDHLRHRRLFDGKLAVIGPRIQARAMPQWGVAGTAFRTGPVVLSESSADIDVQIEWLIAESPDYLITQASNLRALLLRSRETLRAPAGLREVIVTSDTPSPDLRMLAREHWRTRLAYTYICEEGGTVATQCADHDHYLVNSEAVYLEVLRADGTPCEAGEVGRVVLTPLHNFAMPLLRYEIGDYARQGKACAAGRGLPVLEEIVGRSRNMARDPTGRRFWPSFPASLWLSVAPLRQVQLRQLSEREIEVRYVMDRDLDAAERAALERALATTLGYPFGFGFSRVAAIARLPGEKFEDFISLIE